MLIIYPDYTKSLKSQVEYSDWQNIEVQLV